MKKLLVLMILVNLLFARGDQSSLINKEEVYVKNKTNKNITFRNRLNEIIFSISINEVKKINDLSKSYKIEKAIKINYDYELKNKTYIIKGKKGKK